MSVIPGVDVKARGNAEEMTDYFGSLAEDIDVPDGNYWYAMSVTAFQKSLAIYKARLAVRTDRPGNLDTANTTVLFEEDLEDSRKTLVGVLVGIQIKP